MKAAVRDFVLCLENKERYKKAVCGGDGQCGCTDPHIVTCGISRDGYSSPGTVD